MKMTKDKNKKPVTVKEGLKDAKQWNKELDGKIQYMLDCQNIQEIKRVLREIQWIL